MQPCFIRFGRPEDFGAVEEIAAQLHRLHVDWRPDLYKPCGSILSQPELLEAVEEGRLLVAESGGTVAGFALFVVRHVASDRQVSRDSLFINDLAVREGLRGRGIGRMLLDRVGQLAREGGYDAVELQVNAKNAPARAMYASYGFTEKSINLELPLGE